MVPDTGQSLAPSAQEIREVHHNSALSKHTVQVLALHSEKTLLVQQGSEDHRAPGGNSGAGARTRISAFSAVNLHISDSFSMDLKEHLALALFVLILPALPLRRADS